MRLWMRDRDSRNGAGSEETSGPVVLGARRALITFLCIMCLGAILLVAIKMFLH